MLGAATPGAASEGKMSTLEGPKPMFSFSEVFQESSLYQDTAWLSLSNLALAQAILRKQQVKKQ